MKEVRMNVSSNFFSDPKVILSLFALLISFVSLIWTLANQWEQNRRWDNLNSANIAIKEIRMVKWKELTLDEAKQTKWGYDPSIYSSGESFNAFQIPYHLIARDSTTREKIKGVNPVFTIPQMDEELRRVGYTNKVSITKLFKPFIIFENVGKTDASDLSIEIDAKLPNEDWKSAFKSNALISLPASQKSNATFDVEFPIGALLPAALSIKIKLVYKDLHKNIISNEIKSKWISENNSWSYGEI